MRVILSNADDPEPDGTLHLYGMRVEINIHGLSTHLGIYVVNAQP